MRSSLTKSRISFKEEELLSIDDRIQKARMAPPLTRDSGGNPVIGILDNVEKAIDARMIENESEILSLLMKASGTSQHVVPSFYEGGDDVFIENKQKVDVTVTDADRRAIHTVSNYYNTLGIYRDDFDKTTNDKLARNAYYAICEKAMMDYMRSVQFSVKDSRNGDTIESATDFFNNPNPQDDMGSIFAALIRDITRYDAGVLVKSFNKGGFCTEMKPYLSTEFWREQDRVPFIVNVPIMNTVDLTGGAYASHQQPTYQGWWSHGYTERFWQRSRTGVYIPFQPEEISYFMMYPRTDGIYGTDFIKFLKYQIQYLIDSTKAAGKTFENGVVPSMVWEHPEIHTIPQLKQRIAELKYNNQGWQRFGSVIHTVQGEKVSSMAQSLHDMQWLEGQKFVAQLVWATWGFSPEEFMGGGENRASSYVKRNITKSRLLYPLMTFLEQRINRDILPYLKGYRKFWKFSFVRDIELDDEQKVATTNSIKASTFLQYYQSGFPIEASMELSGLDKNKFKFNIDLLEAEIMQNQLMMAGQQPGEMTAGGLEDQEAGRYGPGSESYVDAGIGDTGQGAAQFDNDPRDPSIDEEQYKKAYNPENGTPLPRAKPKDRLKEYMEGRSDAPPVGDYPGNLGEVQKGLLTAAIHSAGKSARRFVKQREKQTTEQQGKEKQVKRNETATKLASEGAVQSGEQDKQKKRQATITPKEPIKEPASSTEGTQGTPQKRIGEAGQTSFGDTWKAKMQKSLKIDKKDTRPDQDYDPYWLAQGIKVEMEHTNDPEIAKEIAKDHLDEFPQYYEYLKKMENGLRKAGYQYDHVELYGVGEIIKAKVYITHPSEAPKGRAVRRGNKGGYYYITNERQRGGGNKGGDGRQPQKKKKSGGKGWETGGGGESQDAGPMMPPSPPDIEGAQEQIKIEGNGIGLVVAIMNGRLVVKKLDNGPTNQFIKIVEKKSGENANVEKIVQYMVQTAQEMGLEVYE